MRYAGRISDWNDDKGYGFVEPNGGGTRAFVHISAFERGSRRPVDGDLVSYLPGVDERGRARATQVRFEGQKPRAPRQASRSPAMMIGLGALGFVIAAAVLGLVSVVVPVAYVGMSTLSYLLYMFDKAAAHNGRRRVAESNLHLADLLGGWPGALVAQQQFRHKTQKRAFRVLFWMTVVVNVALAVWLVRSGAAVELGNALLH